MRSLENEGKFHFRSLVHFFGPGTWIHGALNHLVSPLGDFLYRLEYSHWNDFLMGPAIVSVLFAFVFLKIAGAVRNSGSISLNPSQSETPADLDHGIRFARILMNVGLFWFFIQAWAEKAGYLRNPHSNDEIDLPFEFAGTMLGFWMARVLTKPFDERAEKFRSNFVLDFVASGVIGLLYTLIVGALTEGVSSAVARSLYSSVPASLELHEYTSLQQHMRPIELLLLAGGMWWGLNWSSNTDEITQLSSAYVESETDSRWPVLIRVAQALALTTGYLLVLATMLMLIQPQGSAGQWSRRQRAWESPRQCFWWFGVPANGPSPHFSAKATRPPGEGTFNVMSGVQPSRFVKHQSLCRAGSHTYLPVLSM